MTTLVHDPAHPPPPIASAGASDASSSRTARLEALAKGLERAWRFACRMGLDGATAEDVSQQAFVITTQRLGSIDEGKERAFLMSTVVHLVRRERARGARHEQVSADLEASPRSQPDVQLDDARARELLDRSLAMLDDDLRAVFVLHEIERETMAEIAQVLEIPQGTVASRLRRAREEWVKAVERLRRGRAT